MPTAYSITIFLKIIGEHRWVQSLYNVHTLQTFIIVKKFIYISREIDFGYFS